MATRADFLATIAGELGYCRWDDPAPGSKYGRWYADLTGDSDYVAGEYCAMGTSWAMSQVGLRCSGFPGAYCPAILAVARAAGACRNPHDAAPGDVIMFDWNGDGEVDHVGVCEVNAGGYLQTLEFNTVLDGRSGCVARRTRSWGSVAACIVPDFEGGGGGGGERITVDGWWGGATTSLFQKVMGTPIDGEIWHQWPANRQAALTTGWQWDRSLKGSLAIREMQRRLGVEPDGIIGGNTIRALQARMGTPVDGRLDGPSRCVMAMQRRLNDGEF